MLFTLHEDGLSAYLSGDGGEVFRRYINDLIRGTASFCKAPPSECVLQSKGNIHDGGVDGECRAPFPNDPTGWFGHPTVWQFKSSEGLPSDAEMLEGINKPHMVKLIKQGFALRWVARAHAQPDGISRREEFLSGEVSKLHGAAPRPRFLALAQIVEWASHFPSMRLRSMGDQGPAVWALETWSRTECTDVPKFVMPPSWEECRARIIAHASFGVLAPEPVLGVHGLPGVGKNRLVCEALLTIPQATSLVIFAHSGDDAIHICRRLVADSQNHALVVADESDPATQMTLSKVLRSSDNQIRAIALDNSEPRQGPSAVTVPTMSEAELTAVIERNYPEVSQELRGHITRLAGGFVRFAAELCGGSGIIADLRRIVGARQNVLTYLKSRLDRRSDEFAALLALSMFAKVGITGGDSQQLRDVCELCDLDVSRTREALLRVKNRQGFVTVRSRYAYVTPQLVADAATQEAWNRWGAQDATAFYGRLSPTLKREFHKQIARAGAEVRESVAKTLQPIFDTLCIEDLSANGRAKSICTLVEISPERFLGTLRATVEAASTGELTQLDKPDYEGSGLTGNQELASLCQTLVALPECFGDVERILYRLARHETSVGRGQNARAAWFGLFELFLSGSAIPFVARVRCIEDRIASAPESDAELLAEGLLKCFSDHRGRSGRSEMIAGQIPPPEWRPITNGQVWDAQRLVLSTAGRIAAQAGDVSNAFRRVVASKIEKALSAPLLPIVAKILADVPFGAREKEEILAGIDGVLYLESSRARKTKGGKKWITDMNGLRNAIAPRDVNGRVRMLFSRDSWHMSLRDEGGNGEAASALAIRYVKAVARLKCIPSDLLEWLFSKDAQASDLFGEILARVDPERRHLECLWAQANASAYAGALRGYLGELVRVQDAVLSLQITALDALSDAQPFSAFDVAGLVGDPVGGFARCIALVEGRKVPASALKRLYAWVGGRRVNPSERERVSAVLRAAAQAGDERAWRTLLEYITLSFYGDGKEAQREFGKSFELQESGWYLIETTSEERSGRDDHHVVKLAAQLAEFNPSRMARAIPTLLQMSAIMVGDKMRAVYQTVLASAPAELMDTVGAMLLNPEDAHVGPGRLRGLFQVIPADVVMAWVNRHHEVGAEVIAYHLPAPYRDLAGKAIVPEIVDRVLGAYPANDKVVRNYSLSLHSFWFSIGNPAGQMREDARLARELFDHPNLRVREWARLEVQQQEAEAKYQDERSQEFGLP